MKDGYWCTSGDNERYDGEQFPTKKEAIADGKLGYGGDDFWVGQIKELFLGQFINIEDILENANCSAEGEVGEAAEDFLLDLPKEEKEELEKMIIKYLEDKGYKPNFCSIRNSEHIIPNPKQI